MEKTPIETEFKKIVKSVKFWRLEQWVNEMGLKGWELYDMVTSYKSRKRTYYFRKPEIK